MKKASNGNYKVVQILGWVLTCLFLAKISE
jgi:hypothetical protein